MYRSQQVAWPSFVGSALTVIVYIVTIELLINLVSSALWTISVSLFIAQCAQFIFLTFLVFTCNLHTPGTLRCLRCSDLKNWGPFVKIALITLSTEIIESYNG